MHLKDAIGSQEDNKEKTKETKCTSKEFRQKYLDFFK